MKRLTNEQKHILKAFIAGYVSGLNGKMEAKYITLRFHDFINGCGEIEYAKLADAIADKIPLVVGARNQHEMKVASVSTKH